MRMSFWSIALFSSTVALSGDLTAEEKKAAAKLDGEYTIVSGEEDGKPVPAAHLKGSLVRFTGTEIVSTDKDQKPSFAATYTLDTGKKPWVIQMKSTKPKEGDAAGLVKTDGGTLTLVYALPGATTPTEFKTREKGQHLFVLKRVDKNEK